MRAFGASVGSQQARWHRYAGNGLGENALKGALGRIQPAKCEREEYNPIPRPPQGDIRAKNTAPRWEVGAARQPRDSRESVLRRSRAQSATTHPAPRTPGETGPYPEVTTHRLVFTVLLATMYTGALNSREQWGIQRDLMEFASFELMLDLIFYRRFDF